MKRFTARRCAGGCMLGAVVLAVAPLASAVASGPIWLPMVQATHVSFDNLHPAMVTYRNHAYILSVGMNDQSGVRSGVYFTTNESGTWTTRRLSALVPADPSDDRTSIAIDPSTRQIYAVWVRSISGCCSAVDVWMRSAAGVWSGPSEVYTDEHAVEPYPASIVAASGMAYVAFIGNVAGSCANNSANNVLLTTFDGSSWSAPQNLTSCAKGAPTFVYPKLALDGGHLYLVSAVEDDSWDLWYMDNANGAWSQPVQITRDRVNTATRGSGGEYSPFEYAIAASGGTAYIAYTKDVPNTTAGSAEVFLAAHPRGGPFSVSRVTHDPNGCAKYNLSLVARAGRLGLSYILGYSGLCRGSGADVNTPHVLTGTFGHLVEGPLAAPRADSDCLGTALSSDGDIFRLAVTCRPGGSSAGYNLYYMPEFLDVVGPTMLSFTALATGNGSTHTVRLAWSAQDPTPGSGVAYYTVQVRVDGGPWQGVVPATRSTGLIYTQAHAGHHYTFRVRARDKVNNWGAWALASAQVS